MHDEVIKIGDVMLDRIACQYRLSFFEDYLEEQEQVKPIETCQSRKGAALVHRHALPPPPRKKKTQREELSSLLMAITLSALPITSSIL